MVEGFSLEIEEYCSYCGDFEPDVDKAEVTSLGERASSYMTTISCKNAYKCARMAENLRKRTKRMSIKDCPYHQEHGDCYDCPYYGDGDEDWCGEGCPYDED